MRITVDIDEDVLNRLLKATKEKKKSTAIALAVNEFLRSRDLKGLIAMAREDRVGYNVTNDEIEENQYGDD